MKFSLGIISMVKNFFSLKWELSTVIIVSMNFARSLSFPLKFLYASFHYGLYINPSIPQKDSIIQLKLFNILINIVIYFFI